MSLMNGKLKSLEKRIRILDNKNEVEDVSKSERYQVIRKGVQKLTQIEKDRYIKICKAYVANGRSWEGIELEGKEAIDLINLGLSRY